MSRRHPAGVGLARTRAPRLAAGCSAGALGVLGSVACAASMILAAVGVGSAAAATSMAGMTGTGPGTPGGALGALVRIGPWLMLASVALVTAAFTLTRRPVTAVPALLAGAVLYAGMYTQRSLPVMYATIGLGYLGWAALALWAVRGSTDSIPWRRPPEPRAARGEPLKTSQPPQSYHRRLILIVDPGWLAPPRIAVGKKPLACSPPVLLAGAESLASGRRV